MLLVFASFGFSVNVSATNRYQWIASTDSVTISYDTQSVEYSSTPVKTVDVWILWKFTKDGARNRVNNRTIYQGAKWDNFSYYLEHDLVSKNSLIPLEIVYYDVDGKVIKSTIFDPNDKGLSIVPNSLAEKMRDKFIGFFNS